MVPAASVDATLAQLVPLLDAGDIVIDGGNSWFKETQERAKRLSERGLHFVGAVHHAALQFEVLEAVTRHGGLGLARNG